MNAHERLWFISVKTERANEHLHNLDSEIATFIASEPYKVAAKRDPQTRKIIYFVNSVEPMPARIAAIVGDIIQNLRSALDHLAYQLVLVNGGVPTKTTAFPIFDTLEKYNVAKIGMVKGMSAAAKDAIDAAKPYQSGNLTLWQIYRLNNIDKHRQLLLAGARFHGIDVWGIMLPLLQATMPPAADFGNPSPVYLKPTHRLCPLKDGDILFIDGPDSEPKKNLKFAFDISFVEEVIGNTGEPLLKTLDRMGSEVHDLIVGFKSLL